MKGIVAVVICVFLLVELNAQYPKHIIQLRDKGSNTFSLANPNAFLSARAIERRNRYNIAIDSFDLPLTQRYLDSIRLSGNVTILSTSKWLNQVLVQTTDQAALQKISKLPFVVSSQGVGFRNAAEPSGKIETEVSNIRQRNRNTAARTAANALDYGNSYNQIHIHEGEYLHNKGFTGSNMHIAVLDAGFYRYKSVTAFDSIRLNGQVLGEKDFVAFDNSVNEDDTHGMYCLSIMAANWPGRMVGTAPKASYWLIRTENVFYELPIEEHNWVAGAEFADSAGADMISSSLGYYDFDNPAFDHTYADFYRNATMVSRGATMAAKKGMIVMNSAGNEGNRAWKYMGFPADADSVCAVGAIDTLGNIAGFSSYGYPGKVKPNIVSVGWNTVIAGLGNQPVTGNGTSYANPNAAGLVACLWQAFPMFNNMKILDAVYRSSDRYNNPDDRYGYGIPNFRKAYEMLEKEASGLLNFDKDWWLVAPNPFRDNLVIYIKPPENGKITLRLVDAAGRIVQTKSIEGTINQVMTESFTTSSSMPAGIYFIQYISSTQKQVKKLVKY
ncbi:S8 family peptidase [Aridibaculum aurantiacum]|uniref:S8 family peptidase n=1 Tax=Aridibaculum aurantiacum TaxID=2810307 RepID=UPI001A9703C3|nr:S8 family peptidase [Aridibaculum aurantiacum]